MEKGFRVEDIAAAKAELTRSEGELEGSEAQFAEARKSALLPPGHRSNGHRPGNLVATDTRIARLPRIRPALRDGLRAGKIASDKCAWDKEPS